MLPDPPKVHAADDNTSKYLYVIGTIAAYGGIDIDVNSVATRFPNFVDDVMALADEIYTEYAETYGWTNDTESGHTGGGSHRDGSDGVIQAADDIQGYLDYLVSGLKPFNPVASLVDYRFVFCLIRAIARWCDSNIHTVTVPTGSTLGGVSSTGYIDFYTKGSFSFIFPTISDTRSPTSVVFLLNDCMIRYNFYINGSSRGSIEIIPNNYDFYCITSFSSFSGSFFSGEVCMNRGDFNSFYASDGSFRYFLVLEYQKNDITYSNDTLFNYYYNPKFVSGGKTYQLVAGSSYGYFANVSDSSDIYNNLNFNSGFDALAWFWDMCGINIRRGSPSLYGEVDTSPPPIVIDNTKYDQTVTNITNTVTNNTYQEGDSVEMVFPSYYVTNNYYNYDDYRQHPEYILDFNQDGLLNTDFNMPSYDGNQLANKFPFCIPFDVYNLVSNLVAEPEAPQFHWLVLPANSFGMSNDNFYIDLDFTPYNFLVQLMRFFIAAGFVVWLMVKTKDLMQ